MWIVAQKNIQRVEDLRGKMIGVGGNWGTQFYQVLEALKPSGVDKDVQLVSTGDVANGFLTLQQGSMPAVALTPPYSILAKTQGYRDLVKTSDVITGVADDRTGDDQGEAGKRSAEDSPGDPRGISRGGLRQDSEERNSSSSS